MVSDNLHNITSHTKDTDAWFDKMVANLRYDQTLIDNDILEEDKKKVYDALISGDHDFMHNYARQASSAFFITNMVEAYFKELIQSKRKPSKIALELSNSKILVWAEIVENDELMEDVLILAEAKINAYFSKYGFHISSTIVEDSDSLVVPEHYRNVAIA